MPPAGPAGTRDFTAGRTDDNRCHVTNRLAKTSLHIDNLHDKCVSFSPEEHEEGVAEEEGRVDEAQKGVGVIAR